ncbi:hypothetical protein BLNAU_11204 [Blattamonas nauphoetae]|uniref:Uncharacterized protein n=1 Tax=Blattamonas nauphoetae TaxID=2049346 RepID=A0ABQ9XSL6_9EUKA|nr:hypothetical protein BLNAU_11204 [Blattamonas nauphoetae]
MFLFSFYEGLLRPARITHPTTFLQDKGLWMFVSLIPLNKMESVHFRNGMLNKISNGIHPNYLDLGMMVCSSNCLMIAILSPAWSGNYDHFFRLVAVEQHSNIRNHPHSDIHTTLADIACHVRFARPLI